MLQRLRTRSADDSGFTLIELLVVILIIGILAAIAIPSFLNQREKGNDASAKAAVRTAQTTEETYFTDNQAFTSTASDLTAIEGALTDPATACSTGNANGPCGLTVAATGTNKDGFTASVTSKSGVQYKITRGATGTVSRTCESTSANNAGGCKGDTSADFGGTW